MIEAIRHLIFGIKVTFFEDPMAVALVSIIICTWNRCQHLAETLKTLRCQRNPNLQNIETIIVDNNSTDQTALIVQDCMVDWPLGKLYYLYESRQGKQFALNLGVQKASGKILAFTDDDVILPDDWILNIVKIFSDPQIEMAGGKTLLIWPDNHVPTWFKASMLAVVGGVDLGYKMLCPPPSDYAPAGANLIVRRSLFDRIGFFSEGHFRYEDYEFGMRAAKSGAIIQYSPNLLVYTLVSKEIINKRYFRRWYFSLGIATARKHERISSPILFGVPRWFWRQILENILAIVLRLLTGKANNIFDRELHTIQLIGYFSCVWHKKLRPFTHKEWIERQSQKRNWF
jgi:glycosyltransferase involved in cell wall biosynthesis